MSEPLYWVIVRSKMKGRKLRRRRHSTIRRMGPMSYSEAQATKEATSAKLDHGSFTVQMSVDRTAYFAKYHKRRYRNDEAYRERMQKAAREWQRNARAAAKGDVTPWLTLD